MYTRITLTTEWLGGAPGIRGLRIPVSLVVELVASGVPAAGILDRYPDLEPEDITESLL